MRDAARRLLLLSLAGCGFMAASCPGAPQAAPSGVTLKRFANIPVDMATGEWIQREEVDLALKSRGRPLELSRNYRSRRESSGLFGYGWSWNHAERLEFPGDLVIHYVTPEGTIPIYPDVSYTSAYASVCLSAPNWEQGAKATGPPDAMGGYGNVAHYYGPIASLPPLVAGGWNFQPPAGPSTILQVDLTSIGATAYDRDHPQYGFAMNLSAGGSNSVTWGHRAYDFDSVDITSDRPSWTWSELNTLQARLRLDAYVQNASLDVVVDTFHLGITYTRNSDGQYKYLPGTTFELVRTNNEYWVLNRDLSRLAFSPDGRLLRRADPSGNEVVYHYDAVGRLAHISDAVGQSLNLFYEHDRADAKVTRLCDSTGRSVGFMYNGDDLAAVTNVMGGVTRYAYDSAGAEDALRHNLVRRTDPGGFSVSCAYYASNSMADRVWKYWDGERAEGKSNEVDYLYLKGTTYSFMPGSGSLQGVVYNASNDISQVYVREGELAYQTSDGFNLLAEHPASRVSSPATSTWENIECASGETNGIMAHTASLTASNFLKATGWQFAVPGLSNDIVKVLLSVRASATAPVRLSALGMLGTNWMSTNTAWITLDVTGDRACWRWPDISILTACLALLQGATNPAAVSVDGFALSVCYRHFDPGRDDSDYFFYYDLAHNMVASDHGGARHAFAYDSRGNLVSWTDPEGNVRRYEYDPVLNKPVRAVDALGHATCFAYDGQGRLISTTDALGRVESRQYDGFGNLVRKTFPDGTAEESDYDANGVNAVKTRNRRGFEWAFDYDSRGNCVRVTDPLGGHRQTGYDAAGRKTRECDEAGVETRFVYDPNERLIQTVSAAGTDEEAVIRHEYDGLWHETLTFDALGNRSDRTYDALGRVIYEVDPLGGLRVTEYDSRDNPVRKYDPLGAAWENFYDARGNIIEAYDRRGFGARAEFNGNNDPVCEVDRIGNRVETVYDANGNISTQVQFKAGYPGCTPAEIPLPVVTVSRYDALNRVTNRIVRAGTGTARSTVMAYDAAGQVECETDPLGHVRRMTYDAAGNVTNTALAAAAGRVVSRMSRVYDALDRPVMEIRGWGGLTATNRTTYDARGLRIAEQDALGRITRFDYDRHRRLVATMKPDGSLHQSVYDRAGRLVAERESGRADIQYSRDALGRVVLQTVGAGLAGQRVTAYSYDAAGRLLQETNAVGATRAWACDDEGNRVAETNQLGFVRTFACDALGRVTNTVDEAGTSTLQILDGGGNLCRFMDRAGRLTVSRYDAFGRLVEMTDPLGSASRWDYDLAGHLVREINPRGLITGYEYDAAGRVTNRTVGVGQPDAQVHGLAYDALGRQVWIVNPDGGFLSRTCDAVGNLIALADARGMTTRYAYDGMNRRTAVTDALGGTTMTRYDAAGNIASTTDPLGHRTLYVSDAFSLKRRQTDPLGAVTTFDYDATGRLTNTTDALGGREGISYDAAGNIVMTVDRNGAVSRFDYDAAGRVVRTIDPLGYQTRRTYDAAGNVILETDKRGYSTATRYDALNRPVVITDPASNSLVRTYDACGNKIREVLPSGCVSTWGYDLYGRMVVATKGAGSGCERRTRYRYDGMDRVVREEDPSGKEIVSQYDLAGNKTVVTDRRGHATRLEYDPLNRLVCTTDALGQRARVEYDAAGRITGTVNRRGYTTRHAYDPAGHLTSITDPAGGVVRKEYDVLGRCNGEVSPNGLVTLYEYDKAGNVTNRVANSATGESRREGFEYDALGRRRRTIDAIGGSTVFTLDGNGNPVAVASLDPSRQLLREKRTQYDVRNLPVLATDYLGNNWQTGYDVMGRKILEVDPLGNMTRYEYDLFDAITAVTDPAGHRKTTRYDAAGRAAETVNALGQRTRTAYDANGNPVAIIDDDGHALLTAYDALNRAVEINQSMPAVSPDELRRADVNGDGSVNGDDVKALEERWP
jgi:YD repeat-containing protein